MLDALAHDKKRSAKSLRWVLPVSLGDVRIYDDVPEAHVKQALSEVLG